MFSIVCAVPGNRVAKILSWGDNFAFDKDTLSYEERVMRDLHCKGISVPEPFGVVPVHYSTFTRTFRTPALIMERINGFNYERAITHPPYDEQLLEHVDALWRQELRRAEQYYIPWDTEKRNVLYCPQSDKVVLIDFAKWKKNPSGRVQ